MKKIAIFVIILAMMTGIAQAGEPKTLCEMNGEDWRGKSTLEKYAWLEGFVAGTYVVLNNYQKGTPIDFDIWQDKGEQYFEKIFERVKVLERYERDAKEKMGIYGVTFPQLLRGIDKLYEEDKFQKTIVDAVYVVQMELTGEKEEIIEVQKRYLLMQPLPPGDSTAINWKDPISAEKGGFKEGYWAKPKIDNPQKKEDYSLIPLFCYGIYK